MDWLSASVAALAGFVFGALVPGFQHQLYRDPAHRAAPAHGRTLLLLRGFAGAAYAAALLLAFRPDHYDLGPALLTAVFALVLVTASSTDFERRIIPNRLIYPALIVALALCWAWPGRSVTDIAVGTGFALGIAIVVFGLGVLLGGLGAFGMGDVKLIVLIGLLTGWPLVMSALFIGMLLAGIPSFALILSGRGRTHFSYGPYLAAGALIALLFPSIA